MSIETNTLSTNPIDPVAGETVPTVTGTGTRSAIISDATNRHGAIPVQTRNERFRSTDVEQYPTITGREAIWKLTPVDRLADLAVAPLAPAQITTELVSGAEFVRFVGRDDPRIGSAGIPEDRIAANAWSSFAEVLAIEVPASDEIAHVTVKRTARPAPGAAHTLVAIEANASAVVVIENHGAANLAENVEILVGDNASLTLVSVQEWDETAHHVANHFATVGRDARLKHVVVSLGGSIVRINPSMTLAGSGADGELLGLSFADTGQHLESQVFMFHQADHTKGRVNYKGALQGLGAHTVWIGDVLIGPKAVGTDSYEQNRNLVLSEGARADSVPNLEIECGDIQGAGHASATGRFDDEQLFYLQARGIDEATARRLVVRGFLAEIVQRIGVPDLQERLHAAIEDELAGGVGA